MLLILFSYVLILLDHFYLYNIFQHLFVFFFLWEAQDQNKTADYVHPCVNPEGARIPDPVVQLSAD